MTKKYSASTGGFYDTRMHGDDIPSDAVEISDALFAEVVSNKPPNKVVSADKDGFPVLADPPAPTAKELILAQIGALEDTVTQRRIREAVLGADDGWLAGVTAQISALRAKL